MNSFFSSHKTDPKIKEPTAEGTHEEVIPYEHEENTEEGSEFLDDAIRMEEQPLGNTGVSDNE